MPERRARRRIGPLGRYPANRRRRGMPDPSGYPAGDPSPALRPRRSGRNGHQAQFDQLEPESWPQARMRAIRSVYRVPLRG